jgi:hypothetical protein
MHSVTSTVKALAAVALLVASAVAGGATSNVVGTVTAVRLDAGSNFGGCMAKLSVSPKTKLPECGASWVSFSCSGQYTDEVRAYRLLDQAQLALAAGRDVQVQVWFDDTRKHNGYCFAYRIDVLGPPGPQ